MKIDKMRLEGCYHLQPAVLNDSRGRFVKTFHKGVFMDHGLATDFVETFYSVSRRDVVRGLHFQSPPHHHAKLVSCCSGHAFDVVLDIRRGSPTEGEHSVVELSAERGNMLYIPEGFAHGMCALTDDVTLVYQVTSVFSSAHDAGIRWDSVHVPWPVSVPLLSDRDAALPCWTEFSSPFVYGRGTRSADRVK